MYICEAKRTGSGPGLITGPTCASAEWGEEVYVEEKEGRELKGVYARAGGGRMERRERGTWGGRDAEAKGMGKGKGEGKCSHKSTD